jgi:hypothetical protein
MNEVSTVGEKKRKKNIKSLSCVWHLHGAIISADQGGDP